MERNIHNNKRSNIYTHGSNVRHPKLIKRANTGRLNQTASQSNHIINKQKGNEQHTHLYHQSPSETGILMPKPIINSISRSYTLLLKIFCKIT